jgi:hypothetical protein
MTFNAATPLAQGRIEALAQQQHMLRRISFTGAL